MNYKKHYDLIIDRGKNRILDGYKETHHILPRCLGGTDNSDNLVDLTAEEHFVAHQLLVKIYPENKNLIYACQRMAYSKRGPITNKMYGWLKKRFCEQASINGKKRIGSKNGSYGKHWYYNPYTLENIKCTIDNVPEGYVRGRHRKRKPRLCPNCNKEFIRNTPNQKVCCYKQRNQDIRFKGREQELINQLKNGKSLSESLKNMGLKYSNSKAGVGKWAKNIRDKLHQPE
jgi:hypothetical protein